MLPPDIGSLTALKYLTLRGTPVSDILALSGLTVLSRLELRRTPVCDISALSGLEGLKHFDLSDTQVSDLLPLLPLTQLAGPHGSEGLVFKNTVVALVDPRIPGSPKSPRLRTMPSAPPLCLPI